MEIFLLTVSGVSLLIGKIALFMYLINSFKLELKLKVSALDIIKGGVPERFLNNGIPEVHIINLKRNILELQTLLWTLGIGEIVGYIFLFLTVHPKKFEFILLNSIYLIVGSLVCQMLTLLNSWFRIKTHLLIRLGFQFGLITTGLMLIFIVKINEAFYIDNIMQLLILGYFFTSVLALVTMLLDALFFDKGTRPFDFNHYSRLVIILGLLIGSSLYFQL